MMHLKLFSANNLFIPWNVEVRLYINHRSRSRLNESNLYLQQFHIKYLPSRFVTMSITYQKLCIFSIWFLILFCDISAARPPTRSGQKPSKPLRLERLFKMKKTGVGSCDKTQQAVLRSWIKDSWKLTTTALESIKTSSEEANWSTRNNLKAFFKILHDDEDHSVKPDDAVRLKQITGKHFLDDLKITLC
jgi:hypothetical protein